MLADIKLLKQDPSHTEKAHEALVVSFYEALGYKKFADIKYQLSKIDIAIQDNGANTLYDIQTGSLVTWPCPYRVIHYNRRSQVMNIKTHLIENINYNLMGMDFQSYAYNFLASGMPDLVIYYLQSLGVPADLAVQLEPLVTPTLMAYYHGDEPSMINPDLMAGITQLINSGDPTATNFGYLLFGIWTDASPDNNINMKMINSLFLP